MRTLIRAGALSAVAAAALFSAPVAAHATAPGDNGTVKIHDAKTGEELNRNEPHVCTFYLDAFGFDRVQEVDWHIEAWAPGAGSKGETVKTGAITLDAKGHGRTEDLSLPDGHYKLFWNFDGEKGAAKHKVFWTDCKDNGGGGSTPSSSASPSASASESASASASASPSAGSSASPSTSSSGGVSASSSPSAQGGGSGDLAETGNGAPVGLLSGLAAALVAAGGYLVVRRRRA
ncbi:LPXTG cell wall anchor domain-containing protein [Streptomyces panaciradicis]|uniref:LPXTG cell wall anchor domain-containing protein n=1 Tax=Streptomyces panaciradicis TaxID=1470261 RepID=UPI00201CB434|nr:LPXTG cell wall anchor domain-containing protein [Streptomyces panaciradicis]MCL6672542.1 LPXTG cell wall anchor domain-containing protein [Streptomyces panaciradicis]